MRRSKTCPFPLSEVVWDYQILGSRAERRTGSAAGGDQVRHRRRLVPRRGEGEAASAAVRCLAGGAVQCLSIQLRRSGRLHDAAGHRRQDQQPAVFREGQGLFAQHQPRRQFHHAGFRQRSETEVRRRRARSRSRKVLSAWAARTRNRRIRIRRRFPKLRASS